MKMNLGLHCFVYICVANLGKFYSGPSKQHYRTWATQCTETATYTTTHRNKNVNVGISV